MLLEVVQLDAAYYKAASVPGRSRAWDLDLGAHFGRLLALWAMAC